MKAILVGHGKMGRAVEAVLTARGHEIASRVGRGAAIPADFDVAFEFTSPDSGEANVLSLLEKRRPVVSGTTGWDVSAAQKIAAEKGIAFLHATNFSIGVAVMKNAAAYAATLLAPFPEFEAGIVERHHAQKKDAPSGTAKTLAAACADAGKEAPIVSLRQGGQPGEHAVFFEGPDESIELVHRARTRAIFAAGAVSAAEWLLASGIHRPVSFDEFLDARVRQATGSEPPRPLDPSPGALHRRAPRTPQAG